MEKKNKINKTEKKIISTRLSIEEINFLRNLGNGDITSGMRVAIGLAGFSASKPHKGYRVIREQTNQAGEKGNRYTLLLNGEVVGAPLTVSDSIDTALTERYGKNYVMKEVLIKSFIKLPSEVDIDRIYDVDGDVFWNQYSE